MPVEWMDRMDPPLEPRTLGDWAICKETVSSGIAELTRLRALANPQRSDRALTAGELLVLRHRGEVVMSTTEHEKRDHLEPYLEAKRRGGDVLINGLGLGCIASAMLRCADINHVTVIEKSIEVCMLVGIQLTSRFGDRLNVIHADAFKYRPPKGVRYSVVWHDIWPTICADNLDEMATLHRRYGRRCDWQGSWSREMCLAQRSRDRRMGYC